MTVYHSIIFTASKTSLLSHVRLHHLVFGWMQQLLRHHLLMELKETLFFRGYDDAISAGMPGDGLDSYGGFDSCIHCFTRCIAYCLLDELEYAFAHSFRLEVVRYAHSLLAFPPSLLPSLSRCSLIRTLKVSTSRRRAASFITLESEYTPDSSRALLLLLLTPTRRCSLIPDRFKDGTTGLDRGPSSSSRGREVLPDKGPPTWSSRGASTPASLGVGNRADLLISAFSCPELTWLSSPILSSCMDDGPTCRFSQISSVTITPVAVCSPFATRGGSADTFFTVLRNNSEIFGRLLEFMSKFARGLRGQDGKVGTGEGGHQQSQRGDGPGSPRGSSDYQGTLLGSKNDYMEYETTN